MVESNKKKSDYKEIPLLWAKLLDKARYLRSEHDLKEKEYGIPWRTAYKMAVISAVIELEKAKVCTERAGSSEQAFDIVHATAKNVKAEIDKNSGKSH